MAISLLRNSPALQAISKLDLSTSKLESAYERLSSGLRVNDASDDPAGLALASGLKTDARIFTQGIQNISQAISLFSIASSALDELADIVTRQQELATEASNGSYTSTQRAALDDEAQALSAEYQRIVGSAQFNGMNLLDGTPNPVILQAGKSNFGLVVPEPPEIETTTTSSETVGNGTFNAITNYATVSASGVLGAGWVGDFNNDGNMDITMPDQANGSIGVRLGNGDGTFQVAKSYRAPGVTSGLDTDNMYVADFNNDGRDDIIRTNNANSKVWVFLANTDGSFTVARSFAVTNPRDIYAADIDGDSNVDILVPTGAGKVGVLLGNGDGTFDTQVTYSLGASTVLSTFVRSGDLDGDGAIDLVAPSWYSGTVSVLFGNGNGTFDQGVTYGTGTSPSAVAIADIDGDSDLDIISTNYGAGTISVLKNNGNGTFLAKSDYTVGTNPYNFTLGDINGDDALDIVTADSGGNTISILINNGNGTFTARISKATAGSPTQAVFADFNNDSVLDIFVDQSATGQAGILLGNGTTTITYGTSGISLLTQETAETALDTLEDVSDNLAHAKGQVGAAEGRLSVVYSMLQSQRENFEAAASRILDVDVAEEVAVLVKQKILQDSTKAVVAHSNQNIELILDLLKSTSSNDSKKPIGSSASS